MKKLNKIFLQFINLTIIAGIITGGVVFVLKSGISEAKIIPDAFGDALFTTKNTKNFETKFGLKNNPNQIFFQKDKSIIIITLPEKNVIWQKVNDKLEAVLPDYVLYYSILKEKGKPLGIKEEIVIHRSLEISEFVFPISFQGLKPKKINGIWRFFNEEGFEEFYIPKPFMVDAKGSRSEDIEIKIKDNSIIIVPNKEWLNSPERVYPIIIDPSLKVTVLTVHSHPQKGDIWKVEFKTEGQADLKIIPQDKETIEDLDFISLKCGEEERSPKILKNDIIFYPNWSCKDIGEVAHLVNVARDHTLRFEFGNQTAYAFNSPGTWLTPASVISCSSERSSYPASNSIDDSTGTYWWENFGSDVDGSTYEWYITYDLGDTYEVSKIRIYTDGNSFSAPCKVGVIKVCDDQNCSGETNLLSSPCTFSSSLEWQECSFTPTTGRYIEVRGGIYWGFTCYDKYSGSMTHFYEFDAYVKAIYPRTIFKNLKLKNIKIQ